MAGSAGSAVIATGIFFLGIVARLLFFFVLFATVFFLCRRLTAGHFCILRKKHLLWNNETSQSKYHQQYSEFFCHLKCKITNFISKVHQQQYHICVRVDREPDLMLKLFHSHQQQERPELQRLPVMFLRELKQLLE